MHFTIVFASSAVLFPIAGPDNQDLTVFLPLDSGNLALSTGCMFISAAVKPKSNAVGFNLKLFNSIIDNYLL